MFECSGWLELAPDPALDEGSAVEVRTVEDAFSSLLPQVAACFSHRVPVWLNGSCHVLLATAHNHESGRVAATIDWLRKVVRALPGTYGVLHYRDDEQSDMPETFRAITVGRGRVEERLEPNIQTA